MFLHAVGLSEGLNGRRDLKLALAWAERSLDKSEGEPPEVLAERRALRDQLKGLIARANSQRREVAVAPPQAAVAQPVPRPPQPVGQRPARVASAPVPDQALPAPSTPPETSAPDPEDVPVERPARRRGLR